MVSEAVTEVAVKAAGAVVGVTAEVTAPTTAMVATVAKVATADLRTANSALVGVTVTEAGAVKLEAEEANPTAIGKTVIK